ncbi:HlyD family type I secretion periplasmic adaptor subunit [Enterobacteriaceae bacterium 4M9]|nr:HlyD family type I secretion periplasmic adaptor subunit [Enterobacteriaceae bacterium 4M9]
MVPASPGSRSGEQNITRYVVMGWLVVAVGLVGFLLWATFAPLDKGVSSSGTVIVSGQRKTIQAPVSGIIKNILVKEGETVKANQVLVQLNPLQAQAQVDSLFSQYSIAQATESRLLAELAGLPAIAFSPALLALQTQPSVAADMALQNQLFTSRRLALQSEIDGYRQSINGMRAQLKGLQDSRVNKNIQRASLSEQMSQMKPLADEGYLPRNRYLEVQRQLAEVNSSIDETAGNIGQLQRQLLESETKIEQRQASFQQDVRTQLVQTQKEKSDVKTRLETANFDLRNNAIVSPVDGTVVGLTVFTLGGVVNAGEALMDIVPDSRGLVVDTQLSVNLIDKVYNGLPVDLMFTAFNQNRTPKVPGTVTLISADRLLNKNNNEPYYSMQVTVSPEGMKILSGRAIKPGMPVEVFVKTGSRSLLSYLFKPVLDRASTSLTEE